MDPLPNLAPNRPTAVVAPISRAVPQPLPEARAGQAPIPVAHTMQQYDDMVDALTGGGRAFQHFKGPIYPTPYIGGRRRVGRGLATQLKKISPYNNGPHNGEDFAYQTVYNQVLYGKPSGGAYKRRMYPSKRSGGGIGFDFAKQGVKLVKGLSDVIGTTGLKEPNKALWGKGKRKRGGGF